jgi:hypothetical protein
MKIKTNYLILAVAAGFLCAAVSGQVESPPSGEKSLLINWPHPALAGMNKLHVAVLRFGATQDKDLPLLKQLEANVKEKLLRAGIELDTPAADNILTIPELRIYINTLGLENSQQYVFHIRTALARAVRMKDKQNPVFKAEVWQTAPAMQAVSEQDMPTKIAGLVMEQVDGFINAYEANNPPNKLHSDVNETDSSAIAEKQVEIDVKTEAAEYKYVASKSSNIFHKPDCRWAQNISQENLVTYKSKDEAIKAGKRPCKTCNP